MKITFFDDKIQSYMSNIHKYFCYKIQSDYSTYTKLLIGHNCYEQI